MAPTRVFLIRHADVENPRRLLYGHLDGFQLSALGRAQALAVGDRLATTGLKRIVHSPLARAHETAELINSRLASPAILEADPELRGPVDESAGLIRLTPADVELRPAVPPPASQ